MFGVFEYPPFGYRYAYEPIFCRRLCRTSDSPFESYVANVQRQLERIMYNGLSDLVEHRAKQEEPAPEEKCEKENKEGKEDADTNGAAWGRSRNQAGFDG